jgi:CRP-like cAMP-binding protein
LSVQLPLTKKRLDLLLSRAEELCVEKKMTKSLALYTIAVNQGYDSWEQLLEGHRQYQSTVSMLATSNIVCIPADSFRQHAATSELFVSTPNLNTLCQSQVYDYLMQKSPNMIVDALGNYDKGDMSHKLEQHVNNLTCFSYTGKEQLKEVDKVEKLVKQNLTDKGPIYIFVEGEVHVFFSNEARVNDENIYLVSSI